MSSLSWRVRPVLPVAKLAGAAALVLLAVAFASGDLVQWAFALAGALGLTGWALRDLLRPVRLAADPAGITVVTGYLTRRQLPWSTIERVRVDRRNRRGIHSELLEIDAGETLLLLTTHELGGTDPEEVAAALNELRAVSRP